MARTIFLILLLFNLVALAWIYAKGDERINAGREPQRVKSQLEVDKIRIVALAESGLSMTASDGLSTTQTTVSATAVATNETCQAYMGATVKEAQQIAQTLAGKLPAARIAANPIVLPATFEIAIAALASRPMADAKLVELKKLGIKEGGKIREEDDKRFSIVIGSFADRGAAEEALKATSKKGLSTATIVERKPAPEKSMIEIRGSESALKKLPEQIAAFKVLSPATCLAQ